MAEQQIPPGGTEIAVPANQADFAATVPLLAGDAAGWLRWALQRVHRGHSWIGALDRARAGQPS